MWRGRICTRCCDRMFRNLGSLQLTVLDNPVGLTISLHIFKIFPSSLLNSLTPPAVLPDYCGICTFPRIHNPYFFRIPNCCENLTCHVLNCGDSGTEQWRVHTEHRRVRQSDRWVKVSAVTNFQERSTVLLNSEQTVLNFGSEQYLQNLFPCEVCFQKCKAQAVLW